MASTENLSAAPLQRTALYSVHESAGARFVPFAGYEMPIRYPAGIVTEHKHTRAAAGLFDVSHMGQIIVSGDKAAEALETLVPIDIVDLPIGRQRYGFFTNETGGILDDIMVARRDDSFFLVVNAARVREDLSHLVTHIGRLCNIELLENRSLLALQGPAAGAVMEAIAPASNQMKFMDATEMDIDGCACWISRSGYTGEDGFEISCPSDSAAQLANELLEHADVELIGLGARDSLRLEAGLCLYGSDIDTSTSPVEANLSWAISKSRRVGGERAGGYPGTEEIARQFASGASRKRVGLIPQSRTPVRAGAEVFDDTGAKVGIVTSGGFGPSFDGPVAMGYVHTEHAAFGTTLSADVRGKGVPIEVAKLPVVPHGYRR